MDGIPEREFGNEARGVKPVDEAALEAMGGVWPEGEDLDEFLVWLYESRRSGRYD